MEYKGKYILEPYKLGGSTRHECPQCHDRKSFTYYINRYTGEPVDVTVGICNHKNSCGYHLKPYDFFKSHPYSEKTFSETSSMSYGSKQVQKIFIDQEIVLRSHTDQSTFCQWLKSIAPSEEQFTAAYEDYLLGAQKDGAVVFWQIDTQGLVHEGKIMYYQPDGHRQQNPTPNYVGTRFAGMSFTEKISIPQNFRQQRSWCLFGEHLLALYPDKPVYLVESEKTAIVCSMYFPEGIWLATGGCGQLNAHIVEPLVNRRVIVLPDAGCYDKWHETLSHSNLTNYSVCNTLESYPGNTDIADILLG